MKNKNLVRGNPIARSALPQQRRWLVRFELTADLEVSDESTTADILEQFGRGPDALNTSDVTVLNYAVDGGYKFSGKTGDIGLAVWHENDEYVIVDMNPVGGGVALATTAGTIAAASTGYVVSGSVGIHFWSGSSPALIDTMVSGGGGDLTVTAWNPHNVAIPTDTLVIIGETNSGWLIISAVNYCP